MPSWDSPVHVHELDQKTPPPSPDPPPLEEKKAKDALSSPSPTPTPSPARWTSCCMTMDPGAVKYFVTFAMTIFILSFCFYQLAYGDPCNNGALWTLIGSLVGVWFPQPQMNRK